MRPRRICFPILVCILVQKCVADIIVQHQCLSEGDGVKMALTILQNDGNFHSVYGFDATTGTLDIVNGRVDACFVDNSAITNALTDTVTLEAVVDTVAGTTECGANTRTETIDGVDVIFYSFFFHVYAHSASLISGEDKNLAVTCRSDNLSPTSISTIDFEVDAGGISYVLRQLTGASLLLRDTSNNNLPLSEASVGDDVLLSAAFQPALERGDDNYAFLFIIAFLANDPINGVASSASLFINIYPKYDVRTDIRIKYGDVTLMITAEDGEPQSVPIPVEFMGCSEGGVAEIEDKGVEILSYDTEVAVTVHNREANTEETYTALPVDILHTAYTVVNIGDNEIGSSTETFEFLVFATEDATTVTIPLPAGAPSVTLDSTVYSAGETLTFTLDKMQTFHISFTQYFDPLALTADKPVGVLTGNRNSLGNHNVLQIPPNNRVGKQYVLPVMKENESATGAETTYFIAATTTETTTVLEYTGSDDQTYTSHTVIPGSPYEITVNEARQCEILADHPVLVLARYQDTGSSTSAVVVVPAINQGKRMFDISGDFESGVTLIITYIYKEPLRVEALGTSNLLGLTSATALGPGGYKIATGSFTLSTSLQKIHIRSDDGHSPFLLILASHNGGATSAYSPLGVLYPENALCVVSVPIAGDLIDNDCDGRIDEDIAGDGIDNDGDGAYDEDPPATSNEYTGATNIRPINCKVSADPTFPTGTLTYDLTDADGCPVSIAPFNLQAGFTPQTGTNLGGAQQMKVLYSGAFQVAMFVGYPKLYFRCDIRYCYSVSDTSCTTDICQTSGARKKRQSNRTPVGNISSSVWVYPVRHSDSAQITVIAQNTTVDDCLQNKTILISGSMLLGVALVSMGTVCCMCMMFRKRWDRKKKHTKPDPNPNSKQPPFARKFASSNRY